MTHPFALLRLEARRSVGLLFFPLLLLLAAWLAWEQLSQGVALWPVTHVALNQTISYLGPLLAGIAAWMAGREQRQGMEELLESTPYPALTRSLLAWLGTILWGALAYLLVALFLFTFTALRATWGAPAPVPVLHGLLALLVHAAWGFLLGSYFPGRFTAPLVAIVFFVVQNVLALSLPFDTALRNLVPLDVWSRSVFHTAPVSLIWGQLLWLGSLLGVAVAGLWARRERNRWSGRTVLLTLLPTLLSAILLLQVDRGDRVENPVSYEPLCTRGQIPICVHPAYEALLPETAAILRPVLAPLHGIRGAPTRAAQRPLSMEILPDGTLTFFLYDQKTLDFTLPQQTIETLVPITKPDSNDAQRVIHAWLYQQAGLNPAAGLVVYRPGEEPSTYAPNDPEGIVAALRPDDPERMLAAPERFKQLAPAQQRAWLAANYAALRNGEIGLEELP